MIHTTSASPNSSELSEITEQEIVKSFFADRLTYNQALPKSTFRKNFPAKTSPALTQQLRDLWGKQFNRRIKKAVNNVKKWYEKEAQRVVEVEKGKDFDDLDLKKLNEVLTQLNQIVDLEIEEEQRKYNDALQNHNRTMAQILDVDENLIQEQDVVDMEEINGLLTVLKELKESEETD